ncbi:MAG: HAMP domain-containing histidine kinase [Firmicutes bacterium]|nr:HAMP domain-containing histidine kinase [Bacillota bacterium]
MNKRKPFISLTVKMSIAVMIGLTLSVGTFISCSWLENNVFAYYYQNDPGYHYVMDLVALALSFLTLLTTILIYNGKLLSRIAILSSNIQKVSDGDLEHRVYPLRNDELGALAVSVDNMRTSIIQKHQNERDAWQANQQLITEMSHDIRTPLTSLIGYLDIIEDIEFSSKEELDRYVSACRDKAFQLKDLSDKLFQYFLVYGRQAEKELEKFDASILFQQILMEHSAELMGYGYKVDFLFSIPEVEVLVDISRTRRLFDNIFSNIMKYGDSKEMVSIDARGEAGKISIEIANLVADSANKVESTKIGLKTCEKICSVFGGQFTYEEENQRFSVKVILPMVENEPNIVIMDETELEIMKEQEE